jgi:tetratricopeptide (TPR) repeat protein
MDWEYFFHGIQGNNDSSYNYYISYLNRFDSTNADLNYLCNYVTERIGDYYQSKGDYRRAIAYYDSAGTKYRDRFPTDSKLSYYESLLRTKNKICRCYLNLHNPQKALSTLAPILFSLSEPQAEYMDSLMLAQAISVIESIYSKQQIRKELQSSSRALTYSSSYKWVQDSSYKILEIVSNIRVFGTKFKLVHISQVVSKDFGTIPNMWTRKEVLTRYKNLPIIKQLEN